MNILRSSAEYIRDYNVFISEEDENNEIIDQDLTIKKQRYATRLYIPLLTSKSRKKDISY